MLTIATTVFLYYTTWTLLMVFLNPYSYFIVCFFLEQDTNNNALSSPLWTLATLFMTYFHHESGLFEFPLSSFFWDPLLLVAF